ncbi:hypothetical protein VTK73DRAFT_4075 [Phialemonium thermophilum]|uniref:Spen paralogue and orthologue SPOC C-terminal domain-containing protein n=1 Tax=Phialemonium thermophilum TaxID=223376 RepID=A0ABR3VCD0_9PEZI
MAAAAVAASATRRRRRIPSRPRHSQRLPQQGIPGTTYTSRRLLLLVFSSVKSPTGGSSTGVQRRSSVLPAAAAAAAAGPGVDPEVDRMLQDDDDETNSPPYSPTEETDPDVVWRGELAMNGVASFPATAKHVGGAKLVDTVGLPWTTLIPRRLTVAGRIEVQRAVEYICGLRYSQATDIVVVSLQPAGEAARPHFLRIYDYFLSKNRYGVTGEKGVANVRDTYLVPVPPGGPGNQPEFMLNLADNFLPETRAEPMLLAVFVYRNTTPDSAQQQQQQHQGLGIAGQGSSSSSQSPLVAQSSPTPAYGNHHHPAQRTPSVSAPAFSPTSPQGSFSQHPSPRPPSQTTTPIQPPPPQPPQAPHDPRLAGQDAAQRQGEQVAREILGPLFHSPTVTFLLPHAYQMSRREWELIKRVYEREPRTRDDLVVLNAIIEKEEALAAGATAPPPPPNQAAGPQQQPQQQAPLPPAAAAAHHPPPGTSATPVPLPPHAQHSQTPIPPPTNQYAPPASQTPVPPPNPGHVAPPPRPVQPQRTTPIPPPPIPPQAGGPPRQTPIPPPPIPPHATAAAPPA